MNDFNTVYQSEWKKWLNTKFYRGKTIGIYLLLTVFIISLVELTINRISLFTFIPLIVMTIADYAVFTDLVAHLWYDEWQGDMSFSQFIKLIFSGRTHDIYGLLVFMVADAVAYQHTNKVISVISGVLIIVVMYYLFKTRFYH